MSDPFEEAFEWETDPIALSRPITVREALLLQAQQLKICTALAHLALADINEDRKTFLDRFEGLMGALQRQAEIMKTISTTREPGNG